MSTSRFFTSVLASSEIPGSPGSTVAKAITADWPPTVITLGVREKALPTISF